MAKKPKYTYQIVSHYDLGDLVLPFQLREEYDAKLDNLLTLGKSRLVSIAPDDPTTTMDIFSVGFCRRSDGMVWVSYKVDSHSCDLYNRPITPFLKIVSKYNLEDPHLIDFGDTFISGWGEPTKAETKLIDKGVALLEEAKSKAIQPFSLGNPPEGTNEAIDLLTRLGYRVIRPVGIIN